MLQVNPADRPDIKEVLTGLEAIAIAMDVDLKGKVVSTHFSLFLMDQSDFHYSPLTVSPLCCLVNLFPWLFYNKLNDLYLFICSYLWSVRRQTHSWHHHWQHFILYPVKQNRFHVAMGLYSNRLQKAPKCGKNIDDTLSCTLFVTFLFLPHSGVICDLSLYLHTASWNLFVK